MFIEVVRKNLLNRPESIKKGRVSIIIADSARTKKETSMPMPLSV